MLIYSQNSKRNLWAEAISTACFIRNRLATKSCKANRTPYEVIQGRKPDVGCLKVFGSEVFVFKPKQMRSGTLDPRAEEGIFIGFCKGDAYCMLLSDGATIIAPKDVTIQEGLNKMDTLKSENVIEFEYSDGRVIFDDKVQIGRDFVAEDNQLSTPLVETNAKQKNRNDPFDERSQLRIQTRIFHRSAPLINKIVDINGVTGNLQDIGTLLCC